jgi:shikimate kinase
MALAFAESVCLAGMMGAGKSTVAAILGRLLRLPVLSTDALAEAAAGKSVARIFAEDGEPAFRSLERRLARTLPSPAVVDLGGGAFCDAATAERLLATTRVAFLDVSAREAARRIAAGGGRPLAAGWEGLLRRRLPLYRRAHVSIRVDGLAPEAVARRLLEAL